MEDERGLFYYPNLTNKEIRMYVRETAEGICFRLWNRSDPELWEKHGWVPYEAIQQAAAMHQGKKFDPNQAYDLDLAVHLIREKKTQRS